MYLRGKLSNLFVNIFPNRVHVSGSLCTYRFGKPFQTLTREETAFGIEKLSDELHIDMSQGSISRLDFGTNLILDRPFNEYIPFLGDLPNHTSHWFGSGKNRTRSFSNGRREIRFYDKIREVKKKGHKIPDAWLGHNVCRYEVSFRHPAKDFHKQPITANMLYENNFFLMALERWKELYFKIHKIPQMKVIPDIPLAISSDLDRLALNFLAMDTEMYQMLMSEIERRPLTRSQRSRLRTKLINSRTNKRLTIPDTRITELNQKIHEAVRIYQS